PDWTRGLRSPRVTFSPDSAMMDSTGYALERAYRGTGRGRQTVGEGADGDTFRQRALGRVHGGELYLADQRCGLLPRGRCRPAEAESGRRQAFRGGHRWGPLPGPDRSDRRERRPRGPDRMARPAALRGTVRLPRAAPAGGDQRNPGLHRRPAG